MRVLKSKNKVQLLEGILFLGFLLGAYFLCRLIPYSSGDDAYFSEMARGIGFFEYLNMRYANWTGRMSTEALIWITFRWGREFWAIANAIFLVLLPLGLIRIIKKIRRDLSDTQSLYLSIAMLVGVLLLGMEVFGYGSFWITGSIFYLWCTVAGIWALLPFVDLVFGEGERSWKTFLYSIPCAVVGAMAQEQVASVLFVLSALAVCAYFFQRKRVPWLPVLQTLLVLVLLAFMFLAPGNGIRTESEIQTWLPEFSTLPVGLHLFLTLQWMLSGFANQSKMLFFALWVLGAFYLLGKKGIQNKVLAILAFVFGVVSLLPYVNVSLLSRMGMEDIEAAVPVLSVLSPSSLLWKNWLAMFWWMLALLFTLVLLWKCQETLRERATVVFLFLAAIASVAIMYFTPTIYASGWRVFFMAQILLWLLMGLIFVKQEEKKQKWFLLLLLVAGVINFISKASYMLDFLGREIA